MLKLTFYVADLKLAERVKPVFLRVCGGHRPTGLFVPTKTLDAGCLIAVDAIAAIADDCRLCASSSPRINAAEH